MLTGMTEDDWSIVLEVFDAVQTRSGEPGHDDRKFLEALHYFTVHTVTWRALPREFGKWNSVWKRFWRLSRSGVFEAFFQARRKIYEAIRRALPDASRLEQMKALVDGTPPEPVLHVADVPVHIVAALARRQNISEIIEDCPVLTAEQVEERSSTQRYIEGPVAQRQLVV